MRVSILRMFVRRRIVSASLLAFLMVVSSLFLYAPHVGASSLVQRGYILINGNTGFTAANGVIGGTGTSADPYIMSGWSVVSSSPNQVCIEIDNTTAFFTVENVSSDCPNYGGAAFASVAFELHGVSNGMIKSSYLGGNWESGEIVSSTNVTLSNNTLPGGAGSALAISGDVGVTLANNQIGGNVGVLHSQRVTLSGNSISGDPMCNSPDCGSGTTLYIDHSSTVTVSNNILNGAYIEGVLVGSYSLGLQIINNSVHCNLCYSILLTATNNSLVQENRVSGGGVANGYSNWYQGIVLVGGSRNDQIIGNNVTLEAVGIRLSGVTGISVYHNSLLNNTFQASDDQPSLNSWDNGYPSGGNYWSDYKGVDRCGGPQQNICPSPDGIGDTPYAIPGGVYKDNYPLMKPFVASPFVSVVEGLDGNLYSSVSRPDGSWNGWQSLSGSTPSTPALCRSGPNKVDLVVRGEDSGIYHKAFANGIWSASWDRNPAGVTVGQPTCAVLGTTLYVVVIGATGELWATTFEMTPNTWAASWTDLIGFTKSTPSLVATSGLNRLDLVVRGFDNQIYHKSFTNGLWSQNWDSPSGNTIGAPVAVSDGSSLHIVVIGATSELWYSSLSFSSSKWTSWTDLAGSTPSVPVLVLTPGLNRIDLVVRGMDNSLYHKTLVNGVWSPTWDTLNGLTSNAPAAASDGTTLRVEVVGMDDSLVCDSLPLTGGPWSGWAGMTGASTLTPSLG